VERLTFSEYEKIASRAVLEPYPKQFQSATPSSEKIMKRHGGHTWRPIEWCDECRDDLQDGVMFNPVSRAALCPRCAGCPSDEEVATSLGIIWDG